MLDKKIQVIMSTYNGEQYIKEQIDSILQQEEVDVCLLIRDDGSSDNTLEIIKSYEEKYHNVKWYKGENIGPCKSFFDLVTKVDKSFSYYAFADQDDVWKTDKLRNAIEKLEVYRESPALYVGSYELVDKELRKIGISANKKDAVSFGNSLIECVYPGCTGVFNKKLLELVSKRVPKDAYMHDWWFYMVASGIGHVVYDEEPYVLYRQHERNVLGDKNNWRANLKKRIENFSNLRQYVPKQIEEFYLIFGENLSESQKHLIKCILNNRRNPITRINIFFEKEIRRSNWIDDMAYKGMYLFWKI